MKKIMATVTAFAVLIITMIAPLTAGAADYGSDALERYALRVAAIVNSERAEYGLEPLKYSDRLSEAAIVRAGEIQNYFSHTRPSGQSCFTAIDELGIRYRSAGENIAYGQRDPDEVMNAWMNSSGHRANILSTNYEYIGVGVAYRNGVYYWTQFFASSSDLSGYEVSEETPENTDIPEETETQEEQQPPVTVITIVPAVTTKALTTATDTTAETIQTTTAVPGSCTKSRADLINSILAYLRARGFDIRKIIK